MGTAVTFIWQGSGSSDGGNVVVEPLGTPTPGGPAATPVRTHPTNTAEPAISGFTFPLADACLPTNDALLPGAPRTYRNGTHEGVDFYGGVSCVPVAFDTEVLAAKAGTVIRADFDYSDITATELAELEARVESGDANDADVIDAFRGRQVWIDHGGGVVTRYAHLNGIADIVTGEAVAQGELIGYVGESGSPESLTNPGTEVHLHFEIRVGESYYGAGLPLAQVRTLYDAAFSS